MRAYQTKDGTIVQQALTVDSKHRNTYSVHKMVLGVILDVQMSDAASNKSSQRFDNRRGAFHTASVYVVEDGTNSQTVLRDVIITPDSLSGLNDFSEQLPKGSSSTLSGEQLSSGLHKIDPYSLDGEWCIVGFLGANFDMPFIVRWFPHARNVYDPATSGAGAPKFSGVGSTLTQDRRFFKRINGVEYVITKKGDLYLSTTYSGGQIIPQGKPINGRYPRSKSDIGGNIKAWVKPSAFFEMTWNPQEDGIGVLEGQDPSLPQTNPRQKTAYTKYNSHEREGLYMRWEKKRMYFEVPESLEVISRKDVKYGIKEKLKVVVSDNVDNIVDVNSKDITVLSPASVLELTSIVAQLLTTGVATVSGDLKAELLSKLAVSISSGGTVDISSTAATQISASGALTASGSAVTVQALAALALLGNSVSLTATGPVAISGSSLSLGDPVLPKKAVINETIQPAWAAGMSAVSTASAAAVDLPTAISAIQAIATFLNAMTGALSSAKSVTTKVS